MTNESPSNPRTVPGALLPFGPFVGVLASFAICAQNGSSALAFGWAMIHGAGPLAVLAFLPLGLGLGLLWAGFFYLRRRQARRGLLLFVGHAVVIFVANEWLLPSTPLKAASSERAVKSAEILSIRDELVTSSAGDPIGLRLVFEVRFSRRVVANIGASAFGPSETEPPWMPGVLDFGGYAPTIAPPPASEDIYDVFEKGVVYRVEDIRMAGSRAVDHRTGRPCRRAPEGLSEYAIMTALRRRGSRRYRLEILGSTPDVAINIPIAKYETSRSYDLEAMYRGVLKEGLEPCPR